MGACAFAVEVQVADVEDAPRQLEAFAALAVDGAGQAELSAVGDLKGVRVVVRADQRQDRSENLLLGDARGWGDVAEDGRLDEVAALRRDLRLAAAQQLALLRADLDVLKDFSASP